MTLRDDIMAQAQSRSRLAYRLEPPPDGVTTTDCSLLVRDSVRSAGAGELPRTAEQQRQATVLIPWQDAKPADLIFFEQTYDASGPAGPDGKIASHVGFSLGAGTRAMLDAHERAGSDVSITDISSDYWQSKFLEVRRLPALVSAEAPPPPTPGPDPWQFFTASAIANASQCPLVAVQDAWPRLVEQMGHCGINDRATQIAMLGTVAIETASTFAPIHEYGTPADWAGYEGGAAYAGRGFIQITHLSNYRTYSQKVNNLWLAGDAIDLVARPDDALDPDVSAAVAALYFRDHGITALAAAGDWLGVRRAVYGGTDQAGAARIGRIAAALTVAPPPPPPPPPVDWRAEVQQMYDRLGELLARAPG